MFRALKNTIQPEAIFVFSEFSVICTFFFFFFLIILNVYKFLLLPLSYALRKNSFMVENSTKGLTISPSARAYNQLPVECLQKS